MMEPKIKVLIVEDSVVMCRVLQRILSNDSEIEVVGIARCCEDAFSSAKELKPDVILIDVEIPLVNGKSCLADLMAQGSYAVIVLSTVSPEQANDTIESLEIGDRSIKSLEAHRDVIYWEAEVLIKVKYYERQT